jgi:hypothetical protein
MPGRGNKVAARSKVIVIETSLASHDGSLLAPGDSVELSLECPLKRAGSKKRTSFNRFNSQAEIQIDSKWDSTRISSN